jgi:hypothetical protein
MQRRKSFPSYAVKVKKLPKEVKDKKATGNDVPGDTLKLLREDGLKLTTRLIIKIIETGAWTEGLIDVTKTAIKKKPKSTKCNNPDTINLIAHAANIVAKILLKIKLRTYLEKISLDLEEGNELGMQLGCRE